MTDVHRTIDALWRIESAKLIAGLARMTRDVGLAEELAQDALVIALERWSQTGVPENPGAWLMATAKHRALDLFRRKKLLERKHDELGRELEREQETAVSYLETAFDNDIDDDLLRLIFTACHPVLATEARVALTLRLLGGLSTEEIARAFPGIRADGRTANREGQAHHLGSTCSLRGSPRPGTQRTTPVGA